LYQILWHLNSCILFDFADFRTPVEGHDSSFFGMRYSIKGYFDEKWRRDMSS